MDPINPGPEDHGQADRRRPSRDPLASDLAPAAPAPARMERLVCGDLQLTVNPVDGSEIEPCPPAERPGRATKRTAVERAEIELAARPPAPAGSAPAAPEVPERQEERERLARLLARGRSVRLTGPAGSGRTALLDAVAGDCRDLAPDGVVRLSGFRRAPGDLLHDLFHAVHDAPGYRPDPDELRALVGEIGAVVVVDDLEFGGAALGELLDATPECAFLFAVTPDVPAPSAEADVEEVFLGGLDRAAGLAVLERTAGRALTEEEVNWAGDLWFESEGLPLRFVQAGALLRQRDRLRASTGAVDEYGVFEDVRRPAEAPVEPGEEVPLPSLGEAAAPAPLLASRLSPSARAALRFAVALGGELPHQAHLPALVGDTHADAALGELMSCGLVSPVGSRYRLAAGVRTQLEAAGYADDAAGHALTAARHYAWWAGHPSVTPERVCAEADAVLAALAAVVPRASSSAADDEGGAVRLARTAAPAFAAGLHWSAWERALRSGAEAARLSGEVAEQAYFHHELGILALCSGQFGRARAELEASSGLRGALADKRGAVAGRRALALLADRAGEVPGRSVPGPSVPPPSAPVREEPAEARQDVPVPAPYGSPGETQFTRQLTQPVPRPVAPPAAAPVAEPATRPAARGGGLRRLARRNLVAAGAGALLAAVLGTVVTLGMTSSGSAGQDPEGKVDANPSASPGVGDGDSGVEPTDTGDTGAVGGRPTSPGPDGTYGTADDPAPPRATYHPSESGEPSRPGASPGSPSTSPRPGGSGGSSTGGTTGGTPGGSSGSGGGDSTGSTGGTPTGGTTTGGSTDGSSTGGTTGTETGGTTGTTGETTGGSTDGTSTGGTTGGTTDTGGATSGDTTGTTTSGSTGATTASATNPAPSTTDPVI
ncbi:ATP-binding protein [Streptomyces rubradiris]|uniref:ATPase AAA n=1 Tax=Streptomyces rubradiris TaxID=285531 RepID=A0ABQ3RHG0_STRRR|nr:ATP-binding protein [Streptomyces rubradiris]GHH27211.1 ATPase AAA [Streptomyces rubradiris]GHI55289.1 ATPase AAA [Streptomyces rubradiris]